MRWVPNSAAGTACKRDLRCVLPPLDSPGCFGRRNCNVNLDELRWDRPDLVCEPQQARGNPRNLQLDETKVAMSGPALRRMLRSPGFFATGYRYRLYPRLAAPVSRHLSPARAPKLQP